MDTIKYRLSDIASIKSGKRLPAGHEFSSVPTKYPYVRARDIKNGKIRTDDFVYLKEETRQAIKKYIIKKGDVAITIVANIGDIGYCEDDSNDANLTENAVRLTEFKTQYVDSRYLAMYLNQPSMKRYMELLAAGAAQAKLGIYKIEKIKVFLPNLPTQRRIASILSAYDNLIENNTRRIRLLEQMAENLYKEWFVRFRFPGHEKTEFENGLPKGWKVIRLAEYADIVMGQSPESEYYNLDKQGLPFHQGVGSYGDFYLIDSVYTTQGKRIAEANSIIFSVRAPVGRINVTLNRIVLGRGVSAMNAKDKTNAFLLWMLKDRFSQEDSIGNGAVFASVTKEELFKQKITMPCEPIRRKFDSIAGGIEKEIRSLTLQSNSLIRQRDLLLPRLMSGKLEVKS